MKDHTKYAFAKALNRLFEHQALDKITVTDIVREAGMSRQSFYRHFKDKYDLVNWYFERMADKSFLQIGASETLEEGLTKKFEFILADRVFFTEAFRSKDYNNVENYDYNCILQFYTGVIEKKTGGEMPEKIRFLLEFYCHASITMTVEWALSGMERAPKDMAQLLIDALPPDLEFYLKELK